jgi:hypothetical protein
VTASDLVRLRAMAELQQLFGAGNLRLGHQPNTVGRRLADWHPTPRWQTLVVDGVVIFSTLGKDTLVIDLLPPEEAAARLAQLPVAVIVNLTAMHKMLHRR